MDNTVGNKISAIRKELGLTQQNLALRIGISRPSLVKIENSQRVISLDEGIAISKALGISLETLLMDNDEEIPSESFVMAFKSKGMADKDIEEISKLELLFDALITQKEIFEGSKDG
jgi:transcriptional regulator with XRE-family HTH domain